MKVSSNAVIHRIKVSGDDGPTRTIQVRTPERLTIREKSTSSSGSSFRGAPFVWFADSTYTEGSPLVLADGVATPVPNDAAGMTEERFAPDGSLGRWWDAANSRLTNEALGDTFELRLTFQAKAALDGREILWDFNIDGLGRIGGGRLQLGRGAGVGGPEQIIIPYFSLESFSAGAGANVELTADGPVDIYGIAFYLKRLKGYV